MIHGRRILTLTDDDLLKLFQSKLAPLQATVAATIPVQIEADTASYFEEVYEPASIVPQEETVAALLDIWERHGMKELAALGPELRKMAKELRLKESTDQKVSDFVYAMY
jgi:hypothetical protein